MSDFDSADVSSSARYTEELSKDLGELLGKQFERSPKGGERERTREGLPPSYRMRADAHYVDQLMSRSADMPLRSIAIDEIDADGPVDAGSLQALAQSIAAHGLVQPLLVRSQGSAYRLIAGRKRLAAARLARLSRVPCFVHQANDEEADALARADNLRGRDEPAAEASEPQRSGITEALTNLAVSVDTIQSALQMLTGRGATMLQKAALDLLQAETRRAAWQLAAAAIREGRHPWRARKCVLGPLVVRVCEGFAAESRLKGIDVMPEIPDWNVAAVVDQEAFACALSGAIFAVMALAEQEEARTMTVAVRPSTDGSPTIDVTQTAASLPAGGAGRFFDERWTDRPGGWVAALGAATAKAVTERHDGDAILIARDGRGSTVRLTFGR